MCTSPNYFLKLKDEYDERFIKYGKRSRLIMLGGVRKLGSKDDVLKNISYNMKHYDLVVLPCGTCISCRLKNSQQKAMQVYGEVFVNEQNFIPWKNFNGALVGCNCFITLTFGEEATFNYFYRVKGLSYNTAKRYTKFLMYSLEKRQYQLFMKRFRRMFPNSRIRFYHCGEYGDKFGRPHHHAIILGFDFADKYIHFIKDGITYYRSPSLEKLWPFGFSLIESVNYESCAYVARYTTKKITGSRKDEWYNGRCPEYQTCSNRDGIGFNYFQKYCSSIYNNDVVSYRSRKGKIKKVKPPKYFDDLLKRTNPDLYDKVKSVRSDYVSNNSDEIFAKCNPQFLNSQESLTHSIIKRLIRSFEKDVNISQEDFYKKGNAFGLSDEMLNSNNGVIKKYLDKVNYHEYDFISINQENIEYNKKLLSWYNRIFKLPNGDIDKEKVKLYYSMYKRKSPKGRIIKPIPLRYNI